MRVNRIITEREFLSGMNILLYNKNTIYNIVITIIIINIIIIITIRQLLGGEVADLIKKVDIIRLDGA